MNKKANELYNKILKDSMLCFVDDLDVAEFTEFHYAVSDGECIRLDFNNGSRLFDMNNEKEQDIFILWIDEYLQGGNIERFKHLKNELSTVLQILVYRDSTDYDTLTSNNDIWYIDEMDVDLLCDMMEVDYNV